MLTSQAEELTGKIARLAALRRMGDDVGRFRTRATALDAPAARLLDLARVLAAFRIRSIAVSLEVAQLATLLQHVRDIQGQYEADRVSIIAADGQLRFSFWQPLATLPGQLEATLRESWQTYIEERLPPHQPDLLQVMSRVPGFGAQINRIGALYAEAETHSRTLPHDDDAFGTVDRITADLHHAWGELRGPGIPEDVLAFLRAATTGGANRGAFTTDVEQWLVDHDLIATVRITLGTV